MSTTETDPTLPLTERQRRMLDYIRSVTRQKGYPPTYRELMARFGFASTNGVACYLKALEKKGFIRRDPKTSRGIIVVEDGESGKPMDLLRQLWAVAEKLPPRAGYKHYTHAIFLTPEMVAVLERAVEAGEGRC